MLREAENNEESIFANITVRLGKATEFSGGLRYIDYGAVGSVKQGAALTPVPAAAQDDEFNATIYTASIRHHLTEDLMIYATTGSSWRPGVTVIGTFSLAPSPLELSFMLLPPEESRSYEIGLKSAFLEQRLRLNVAGFYQDFENYPFRSSTGQFYVETAARTPAPFQRVGRFNFVAPVPVKVYGVEAEISYVRENFDVSAGAAYAHGEISNGLVPCDDYLPRDGVPDSVSVVPTVAQILSTGSTLSACRASYRASQSPPWSASIQSEYRIPLWSVVDVFLRGQASLHGDSRNDSLNPVDDVDAHSIVNLLCWRPKFRRRLGVVALRQEHRRDRTRPSRVVNPR